MWGRKEGEPLEGVFSRAWTFGPSLPSACEKVPELRCGVVETSLSRKLRGLLGLKQNKKYAVKMGVLVLDGYMESLANISVEAENSRAIFTVRTERINGDRDRVVGTKKTLSVRTGRGEVLGEPIEDAQNIPVYRDSLNDALKLLLKKFQEADRTLLCRSCPAQEDSLPRSVV